MICGWKGNVGEGGFRRWRWKRRQKLMVKIEKVYGVGRGSSVKKS